MKKNTNTAWKLFLLIAIILPVCSMAGYYYYDRMVASLPYYAEGNQKVDIQESMTVPLFSFLNQDSVAVDNSVVDGKVWIANYFFSVCPTICPPMMTNLRKIQQRYQGNEDFAMLSLTVDPIRDKPSVLHRYAQGREINTKNWQLLTGEKKSLYRFARKGLSIEATEGSSEEDFFHSEKIVLIDREGHIRGYYDGTDNADMTLLVSHIDRLLNPKK